MDIYLHIKPSCNFLMKLDCSSIQLKANKIHTFLAKDFKGFYAAFYPIEIDDKCCIPFACHLKWDKSTLTADKSCIKVTKFPNDNFLIEVEPFKISPLALGLQKNETLFFGDATHTLTWLKNDKLLLKMQNDKNNNFLNIEDESTVCEFYAKSKENFSIVYFKTKTDNYILYLIEYKDGCYKIVDYANATYININDDKIVAYQKLNDHAHHGIIKTFDLDADNKVSSTLVYDQQKPILATHKEIVPFAFFDAIKLKNFKLARAYLSQNLSERLTDSHLQQYFENFESISQTLSPHYSSNEIALIYSSPIRHAQIFNLTFDTDNRISNITKD